MDSDSVNLGSNPSSPATDFIEEIAESGSRKTPKNRNGTRTPDAHNPAHPIAALRQALEERIQSASLSSNAANAARFVLASLENVEREPDLAIFRRTLAEDVARFENAMAQMGG
jgi:type VI protein secretion system component VasF